ncbi:MAG: 7-cyano-7-deazaguanine synthase [Phormidesmis sp. CAN_BIN36]|nr:7-cyano-7-deazaguanine synthase [Phormidesmis sp. CAN_BIN36]
MVWNYEQLPEVVTWSDSQFAIAHPSPTLTLNERFVIAGDVWLSNRADLLKELDRQNAIVTDLEIVAHLWQQCQVETLTVLQGMFAFAVWDRERQELWLMRDRVGAKTLYYTTNEATRWISLNLRSLNPYRSDELDLVALRDYLCCAFVPGSQTMWRDVRELRPGTVLRMPEDHLQTYWQPQEQIRNEDQSLEWHGKQVRSLLEQIVQESLPADQPVGAYLSGGIDSSCIVALAKKLHDRPVHTYSMHFGENYPNELEFANLVAAHCQTEHHVLEISPETIWQKLPETLAYLDDPIGEGLTVPNLILGQTAHQSVDVILNGEGGDPCFAGPKNKPMLLKSLYGSVIEMDNSDITSAYLTSFQKCFLDLPRLLKPEVYRAIESIPSVFTIGLQNDHQTYLNRLMLLNINFKGADYILTKVNNLTQAAGVQGRSPLFDSRMVELSLQIPPRYKLSGAEEKAVLKSAVADLLPDAILNRPKSGMIMSMQQWFRTDWRRRTRALLLNKKAAIAPYLNQSVIREWLDDRGDGHRYGLKLWLLVTLEIWLQVNRKP